MKRRIKMLPTKAVTAMLAASGLLLLSGSIGGARAALTYYSDTYRSTMSTQNIGVTLLEKGEADEDWRPVSYRNYDKDGNWDQSAEDDKELLTGLLAEDEKLKIGKIYSEEMKVANSGTIGEYVRVTVYRYWTDENGEKIQFVEGQPLDPGMIELDLNEEDWIEDTDAGTAERTVLYYRRPLSAPGGESENSATETSPFMRTITVNRKVMKIVTEEKDNEENPTEIKSAYVYDGKQFQIEVEVDAVQDHNAEDAILSAWGRSVTIEDGEIVNLN